MADQKSELREALANELALSDELVEKIDAAIGEFNNQYGFVEEAAAETATV